MEATGLKMSIMDFTNVGVRITNDATAGRYIIYTSGISHVSIMANRNSALKGVLRYVLVMLQSKATLSWPLA